ncbi:hypothetical protein IAT40_003848 [Kwoniella sp. CBS 6097]
MCAPNSASNDSRPFAAVRRALYREQENIIPDEDNEPPGVIDTEPTGNFHTHNSDSDNEPLAVVDTEWETGHLNGGGVTHGSAYPSLSFEAESDVLRGPPGTASGASGTSGRIEPFLSWGDVARDGYGLHTAQSLINSRLDDLESSLSAIQRQRFTM